MSSWQEGQPQRRFTKLTKDSYLVAFDPTFKKRQQGGRGKNKFETTQFMAILLSQGTLQIWTEHSNLSITRQGRLKTAIALMKPNILKFFLRKYFLMHIKPEGMTQFDSFHTFVFLSSTQSGQNLKFIKKCPCLSSLKNQVLLNSKFF